ncbi:MAG: stage III sporulation protein AB [Oscillospiraceae bacterium]
MRIAAAVLILLCCAFEGARRSFSLKRRLEFLDEIVCMLTDFAIEIRFRVPMLDELIRKQSGIFAGAVITEMESGCDVREAWERACSTLSPKLEETALLRELGTSFGTSDSEGQLQLLELYTERFSKLRESAEAEYSRKGKALVRVGVLCGAAGAVLVL